MGVKGREAEEIENGGGSNEHGKKNTDEAEESNLYSIHYVTPLAHVEAVSDNSTERYVVTVKLRRRGGVLTAAFRHQEQWRLLFLSAKSKDVFLLELKREMESF